MLDMKYWLLAPVLLTLAGNLWADEAAKAFKIGASDGTNYFNREMIVTGMVAQVSIRPSRVFLNLDRPYPKSPFTLIILPAATNQFGDIMALKGKHVEAQGIIKNYHDRPEIILTNTNQLKWVDLANEPDKK
jgi:DNA/RNA endonuclease YhcR with UshA esterase domain